VSGNAVADLVDAIMIEAYVSIQTNIPVMGFGSDIL
jgi:hypothetical protein